MASKADQYRANALQEIGEDYVWGAEGAGGVAGEDDYDCSGFVWAMLNNVGVKIRRMTAHDYMRMGARISKPTQVGADFAIMVNAAGRTTHIVPYIGKGETVEAKGKAYGVVKSTVDKVTSRGGRWYRFPNVDLGTITQDTPKPAALKYPGHTIGKKHKHHDEVRWIQKRLNHHGIKVAVDGDFGPRTYEGVLTFRRRVFKARVQYGIVGHKTWNELAKEKR